MAPRRIRWIAPLAAAILLAGLAGAQTLGPQEDPIARLARLALAEARATLDANSKLPRQAAYEIGVLQAVMGDLEGGVATITGVADPSGAGGPRWRALAEAARAVADKGHTEAVQRASERLLGADRAAVLFGLAEARFAGGETELATLTAVELGQTYPDLAADLLLRVARATVAAGGQPPLDLLGRVLELGRRIPADRRDPDGASTQARILTDLMLLHVAAGNDDAALAAAEAISDRQARQQPLLQLAMLQVGRQHYDAAVDTANKLSIEAIDPATGAGVQPLALARIAQARAAAGDREGALSVAKRAVESARRVIANDARTQSLLAASVALSKSGDARAGSNIAAEAIVVLIDDQDRRAVQLLGSARAQAISGNEEVARQTFLAGRQIASRAKSAAAREAAVTVPAEIGWTGDAVEALSLYPKDSEEQRAARILLARTLSASGHREDAVAVARELKADRPLDRRARVTALCAVVAASQQDGNTELLREALALAIDPFTLPAVREVIETAADAALPGVAIEGWRAALDGAAKTGLAETALDIPGILAALDRALRNGILAGRSPAELATAIEQAAEGTRDRELHVASLVMLAKALAESGDRGSAEKLIGLAAGLARQITPPDRRATALAELGAVAASIGFEAHATSAFDIAEALLAELDTVPPALLLAVSETELPLPRPGLGHFLLRSAMSVENLVKEGSTDLRRLSRVAAYAGQYADSLAIAKRVWRAEERLAAYLDLVRVLAGRPLQPLREPTYYPLPDTVTAPVG